MTVFGWLGGSASAGIPIGSPPRPEAAQPATAPATTPAGVPTQGNPTVTPTADSTQTSQAAPAATRTTGAAIPNAAPVNTPATVEEPPTNALNAVSPTNPPNAVSPRPRDNPHSPTPAGFPFGAPGGSYAPGGAAVSGPTPGFKWNEQGR